MAQGELKPQTSRPASFRLSGTPVLLHHGLTRASVTPVSGRESKYWVTSARFSGCLDQIKQAGYRVALLKELWKASNGGAAASLVLTFDDGLTSDYDVAFPLLQAAGFAAEFFVNTSEIGKPGFLDWPQMKEMQRAGMSFQSHGQEHVALTLLATHALERQLKGSKLLLEDRLGCAVDFFAVPYGLSSGRIVEAALQAGYKAVCTSRYWPAQMNSRTVSRVVVCGHTTPGEFERLLAKDALFYLRGLARSALLHVPRELLLRVRPEFLGVRTLEGRP